MAASATPSSGSIVSLASILTTVLWILCAGAGVAGLRLQYQHAQAKAKEPPPVVVEKMDVKMIGTAASPMPLASAVPQPAAVSSSTPPPEPSLPAIAEPSPLIAFAVPVNAPARVARAAAPARTVQPVEHLVFGTGEGDKPPPEYPHEARLAHEQGTVTVRFTVDEEGHVTDAQASVPSPYSLLNQAAVRAVRDTWDHFPRGKARVYDVSFQFELHQN